MAEHPPEYEYRVTMEQIGYDGMFHPHISTTPDAPSAIEFANARRRRDDHRNVTVERRFAGPWRPVADGDEAPAADRQQAVFDTTTWSEDGIMQELWYTRRRHPPRAEAGRLMGLHNEYMAEIGREVRELRKEVEDIDFNLHPQDVVNIKADLLRRVDTILVYLEG